MAGVVLMVAVAVAVAVAVPVMSLLGHGPADHRVGRRLEGLHRNLRTTNMCE